MNFEFFIMALYHKYRPQKFADIIGQEHIAQTLSNQVAGNKIAHAYLFSGARGIGKTSTARVLAKALNCSNRKESDSEPCNSCNSCHEISESRSIDVIEIDAASHTGVDNVRENIIDSAQFRPTKSKYKIFIIDEAHMLSTAAFNALLKTLEEPPNYVIFILATTEFSKLPETIVSRCQCFNFHKLTFDLLKKHLEKICKEEAVKVDKNVIDRVINKSDGAVRDAIGLLDQLISTGEKTIDNETAGLLLPTTDMEKNLEMTACLLERDAKSAIILLNNLADDGVNLTQFSHDLLELLRLLLIHKASNQLYSAGVDINEKTVKELKKLAEKIEQPDLIILLDLLIERRQQIKTAPLPQLPLEMAIIEWCGLAERQNNNNANVKNSEEQNKTEEPAEKKTIAEKIKNIVSKNTVSREQIEKKWNSFLKTIETEHPSLAFILKMAEIDSVENNTIKLSVEHDFHRDKLIEKICQKKIEGILEQIIEEKVKLDVFVCKKAEKQNDEEIEQLASSLGGEIIN